MPRSQTVNKKHALPETDPLSQILSTLSRQGYFLLLAAIVLLGFGLRTYHLDWQSLWRDEVDVIRFSDEVDVLLQTENRLAELRAFLTRPGHNGPLYYIILRGWRALTGNSEFALRYLSVLGGTVMIALTWAVARVLTLPRLVALLAALLVSTSPYLIWYSQEAKMYTLLPMLVLLAIFAYQQALTASAARRWWIIFVIATSLSFYIHVLSPLMLGVYVLWAALYRNALRQRWRSWLVAMGFLTLPYVPFVIWQAPLLLQGLDLGHRFYPLPEMVQLLVRLYSSSVLNSDLTTAMSILTLFVCLAGLALAIDADAVDRRRRMQLALWLLVPALLIFVVSLRVPLFEDRYLIYLAPAYYVLLALGMVALLRRFAYLAVVPLAVVLLFNGWIWQTQSSNLIKPDFRGAAAYIAANADADVPPVIFQIPYAHHTFAYYHPEAHIVLEGPWTNDGRDFAQVAAEMQSRTAGLDTIWYLASEEAMWDERGLARRWLNENANLLDQQTFVRVDVFRYELLPPAN